ncbi:MAG: type VI secretion system-associated protein TagF [Caulobacteraceae bacterium]
MTDDSVPGAADGDARKAAHPILFGKLPTHGDFVQRGLDLTACDAWDRWASEGLAAARAALGEGFDDAHDRAPPWRFIDPPGRFGRHWRAGALAPSIDAAGRRFMIMVAADGLSSDQAGGGGEAIAEEMEALIYQAFESGWDADATIEAAQGPVERLTAEGAAPRPRWWTLGGFDHEPAALAVGPDGLFAQMLVPAPPASGAEEARP